MLESTCFCNDPFPNEPISEWLTLMISSKSTGECTCDDWGMIGNTSHGTLHNIYKERTQDATATTSNTDQKKFS